ncbi:division/cell wall cluster transcriptional repressor MraZ [Sphaerotilus hippei]|uniref:division/cell wall cluster transcriptional repressor MraZ n=1 Tax=Sphaerotilus hippei TaxID=744406 RepID=UPI000D7676B3|nr:division/cell wall cluster transcriptional repressor MraZ [Sphaerotilus hippei]
MADFHFQGTSALALDAKGRVTVPARHRDLLQALAQGRLTLTKHPEGCLMVFPRPVWEAFRVRVEALPMSAGGWKRIFLGSAFDVDIDNAARVLIAPELRAAAGLSKDVLMLGMGNHLELWDAQRYAAAEAAVLQQPMPDVLQDFSF